MLYFQLTTLTTTGYATDVPVDPFAPSLAIWTGPPVNLSRITVTRLVTMELADRRR